MKRSIFTKQNFSRIFLKMLSFKDQMRGFLVICVTMATGYDLKGSLNVQ